MIKYKLKLNRKYSGFSLMEMIVAIFIFSLVTTVLMTTFMKVISIRKKAMTLQQDAEQARSAIEQMSKVLRTSTIVAATTCNDQGDILGCVQKDIRVFDYSQNKCVEYNYYNNNLRVRFTDNTAPLNSTPACNFSGSIYANIISGAMNNASFTIFNHRQDITNLVDRVTISLKICYNNKCTGNDGDEVVVQSTVSMRDYQETNP